MNRKLQLTSIQLVGLFLLIVSACSPTATPSQTMEAESSQPQSGGTLNLSLGDDFVTFHPYFDVNGYAFKPIVFEAPLRISDKGEFEPWLAESWEVSEDGLSVTLHLRPGIKFHNGREVTADDVIWAVDYARSEDYGHHLSDRLTTCTGATKIDDYTVQVNYSEITHSNLDGLARLYLFPKEAAETIETVPIGTGPFKFENWTPGNQATFVKFDEYWQEGKPYLDKIIIKALPDPQSRVVNLLTGSVDLLMGIPLADKTQLSQNSDLVLETTPAGFYFHAFIFNTAEPPFDQAEVRQAFNYALNRDDIVQTAFHSEATPVVVPYASTSWAYPEDLANYYTYDPDKAKSLLAEAGYPDGFKTQLTIAGVNGPLLDMAQVYQQQLAAIGIEMELVPTELSQYWPKLFESEFAIVSHTTGDATLDPSGLFEGASCCRPTRNFYKITENETWFPKYQQLILESRAELEQQKRKAIYHDAIEIFLEQSWTIPVAWSQETFAYKTHVHNFRTDMDNLVWPADIWLSAP